MDNPDNIFGKRVTATGAALAGKLEAGISEAFLSSQALPAGAGLNIFGRSVHYRRSAGLSFLAGMAGAGLRSGALLAGRELAANVNQLSDMARQNLAAVVHYAPQAEDRKGHGPFNAYSTLQAVGETGCFQLLATTLQEVVDFTFIAHKVAELALLPGICVMDGPAAYQQQEAEAPPAEALRRFLGQSDDHAACPSPAQEIIFGKSRRRIPQWFNWDTPTLEGARKDERSLGLEGAARERYFYHHLPLIMQQVMEEYGKLTGRRYKAVRAIQAEKADFLILAGGAVLKEVAMAAEELRSREKAKVGCLSLSVLCPFPKENLQPWLAGRKGLTVLEGAGGGPSEGGPLLRELRSVAGQLGKQAPALYSGCYAAPLSRQAAIAVFKNMMRQGARKERFFIGFDFTRSHSAFPQHELLLQSVGREYPGIQEDVIAVEEDKEGRRAGRKSVRSLPFAVRRYQDQGPPWSRLSRFYHDTACFHQEGLSAELVADPFQALPAIPAATANFAGPDTGRRQLPAFQPQDCSGCGACFTYCPHSAMPAVAISVQSLVRAGMKMASSQGTPIPQLMGIERKLVKAAEDYIRKNENSVRQVEDFLPGAFALFVEQSKLEGEKLEKAQQGIEILNGLIGRFPVAVTEPFYHQSGRREKGSAQLLSINIDPQACTGCGLCAAICPEGALLMAEAESNALRQLHNGLDIWEQLPDTPADTINQLIGEPEYNSLSATLLSRHFYFSMSGGSTAESGAPAKTVLHWLTAVLESAMQPKIAELAKEVEQMVEELSKNIHQHLSNALPRRDFRLSGQAIQEFGAGKLPLQQVIHQLESGGQAQSVDAEALRRKIELQNDLKALLWALREGPTGSGRARYGVLLAGNAGMPWADDYPYNAFTSPALWQWDGSAPERLLGILQGQMRHALDNIRLLRRASLEVKDKYRPEVHEPEVGGLQWEGLTDAEKQFLPPVLLLGDGRLLAEQGRAGFLELLALELPVKIVVLDNAALPEGSLPQAVLAAGPAALAAAMAMPKAFLLKGSLAQDSGIFGKLRDGLQAFGPALFHLLAPRPEILRMDGRLWPDMASLAVQTRAFPCASFDPGAETGFLSSAISLEGNPAPEEDWAPALLKYKEGGQEKETPYRLTYADWLLAQLDWEKHFRPVEAEAGNLLPMAEYLLLDEKGRQGKFPAVFAVSKEGQLRQYVADKEVAAATLQALRQWNSLRELAGLRSPFPQKEREELEKELTRKYEKEIAELKASCEARLQEQEKELMGQVRIKLRDKLLALSRREEPLRPLEEEVK